MQLILCGGRSIEDLGSVYIDANRSVREEKVNLIPGVKIVGAATLNDLALDASATMWF